MDEELDDEEAGVINGVKRLLVTERTKSDGRIKDLECKIDNMQDQMDKGIQAMKEGQRGTEQKIDRLEAMMQAILSARQMTDAERVAAEEQRRARAEVARIAAEEQPEPEPELEPEPEPEPAPEPEP